MAGAVATGVRLMICLQCNSPLEMLPVCTHEYTPALIVGVPMVIEGAVALVVTLRL